MPRRDAEQPLRSDRSLHKGVIVPAEIGSFAVAFEERKKQSKAERVTEVANDETLSLVNGIVERAVERAYTAALRCPTGKLLSQRDFEAMADHLRDEIILALRSVRPLRRRRDTQKASEK